MQRETLRIVYDYDVQVYKHASDKETSDRVIQDERASQPPGDEPSTGVHHVQRNNGEYFWHNLIVILRRF